MDERIERDSLGAMRIPAGCLYGASTRRAFENFPISGLRFPRVFLRALGLIKHVAARVNRDLGLLDAPKAAAIEAASLRVAEGDLDDQFVVDIFQTGSGTSTNMNANEVIANLAAINLGGSAGRRDLVHPNDDVNLGQSSNDVFPSAIHVSASMSLCTDLLPALARLQEALAAKAREFHDVVKVGRTHLQDAVPMSLGQEFGGYSRQVEHCRARVESVLDRLAELPIGGTAVGTGLNTHPEFGRRVCAALSEKTGLLFREAGDHFEAQAARDTCVELSGELRVLAVALSKIAGDIAWLGSGPRAGLGEILLPAVQPGSSIMPGKVNPVICEMVLQVGAQVIANDTAITLGGLGGRLELNLRMPLIAYNLLQSISILSAACVTFTEKCISGIKANAERCRKHVEECLAVVTALAPEIGYDRAVDLAREAWTSNRTIREVAIESRALPESRLDELLDPRRMAGLE